MAMTTKLAGAADHAGPAAVAAVAEYLRQPHGDGWLTAVRSRLADVLAAPDLAPGPDPDPMLVLLAATWMDSPDRDLSPLAYWLRQQTHPETAPDTPITRLWQALAAEVDAALGAAFLLPDVDEG